MRGAWRNGSFTGDPERYVKEIYQERHKKSCKWVSLSMEALMGNLQGIRLRDFLRERDSISGFLSWTQRTSRF